MNLDAQIEAVLFAAAKPFNLKRLAEVCACTTDQAKAALEVLRERLDASGGGIMLQSIGHEYELVTRPEAAELVSRVTSEEAQGELTRAALETLTILAYRGPMTRPELEQIRGVHSAIILRNLMIRGLVEQKEEGTLGQPVYSVTFEFMHHLGLSGADKLPDYEELRGHAALEDVLDQLKEIKPEKTNNKNSI